MHIICKYMWIRGCGQAFYVLTPKSRLPGILCFISAFARHSIFQSVAIYIYINDKFINIYV